MAFVVAHFLATDEVAVLSYKWICGANTCQWPPIKDKEGFKKAVLEHETPQPSWTKYKIVVMGKYDNYLTAKRKAELALDTSNLETEASDVEKQKSRKKRARKRQRSNNSDDSDDTHLKIVKTAAATLEPPTVSMSETMTLKKPFVAFCQVEAQPEISRSVSPLLDDGPSASQNGYLGEYIMQNAPIESSHSLEQVLAMSQPSETEKHIIKMLEDIRSVQREHTLLLRRLLPVEQSDVDVACPPSTMPELPLQSNASLEEFEAFLNIASNFNSSVKYFGCRTSADLNTSTRRLMSEIFADGLAEDYNWAGRPPKKPFKVLKTLSLILCTLKENPFTKDVPANKVEDIIKDWLKHASFRKKYRERKN